MDDLQSEKEQLEEMRAWWSEYGTYVIAGVVIAGGLLFGYNQYKSSRFEAQVEASMLYEQLAEHVSGGDLERSETVARELANDYANTSYAAQAKLAMAKLYMDKNQDQDAADVLRELLALRGNEYLKAVGRLRLAKILLYQDKPEDVVELLEGQELPAFAALYSEVLGDAYFALDRIENAGDAYRAALANPEQAPTIDRGLVQMKLADLPDAQESAPPDASVSADDTATPDTRSADAGTEEAAAADGTEPSGGAAE